jgi:ribosomal protein S18 acetylase RimI-like enzyme
MRERPTLGFHRHAGWNRLPGVTDDHDTAVSAIVEASDLDIDELSRLAVTCIRETYKDTIPDAFLLPENEERRRRIWREVLLDQRSQGLCAIHSGRPVGFVTGQIREGEGGVREGHVQSLYVRSDNQGGHLGTHLFEAIGRWFSINKCNVLTVGVLTDNLRAVNFYQKMGCTLQRSERYDWHGLELQLSIYFRSIAALDPSTLAIPNGTVQHDVAD